MKIIIPLAGWGKRMRPHTWSRAKPLLLAGRIAETGAVLLFAGHAWGRIVPREGVG